MPLSNLLHLLPRFKDMVVSLTTDKEQPNVSVHLTESSDGPPLMDAYNPSIKLIIKGCKISGCITDGGSRVNIISETTCKSLRLTQWDPLPILLAYGRYKSHLTSHLTRKLDFVLGGHTFGIWAGSGSLTSSSGIGSVSEVGDGKEYHDADSSNSTSRLTLTCFFRGL